MLDAILQSILDSEGVPRVNEPPPLHVLFHRLNNQLGIVLAHAELLEAKLGDEPCRSRASQVISSVLGALNTAQEIRGLVKPPHAIDQD